MSRDNAYRACKSKVRYRTEGEARSAMASIRRRRGAWLRAYQCELCDGGYHLTHTQERPERRGTG